MSKLSTIRALIDLLDQAETALGDARRAFPRNSTEYNILDAQFESVGDAKTTIEERILPRVENDTAKDWNK